MRSPLAASNNQSFPFDRPRKPILRQRRTIQQPTQRPAVPPLVHTSIAVQRMADCDHEIFHCNPELFSGVVTQISGECPNKWIYKPNRPGSQMFLISPNPNAGIVEKCVCGGHVSSMTLRCHSGGQRNLYRLPGKELLFAAQHFCDLAATRL